MDKPTPNNRSFKTTKIIIASLLLTIPFIYAWMFHIDAYPVNNWGSWNILGFAIGFLMIFFGVGGILDATDGEKSFDKFLTVYSIILILNCLLYILLNWILGIIQPTNGNIILGICYMVLSAIGIYSIYEEIRYPPKKVPTPSFIGMIK